MPLDDGMYVEWCLFCLSRRSLEIALVWFRITSVIKKTHTQNAENKVRFVTDLAQHSQFIVFNFIVRSTLE